MNIFRYELRMSRTSAVVWAVVLCALALMYIALYPTFSTDAEATKKMFATMPPEIRSALRIDIQSMLSFLGFFAFTFTNLSLAASLYAMYSGVSLLSREPRAKTTDFLLTKPKSRSNIFVQKFLSTWVSASAVWLVLYCFVLICAKSFGVGDFSTLRYTSLMLALYVVMLWFVCCGLFVSQVMKRIRSPLPITLGVVFGFFILGMVGSILKEDKVRYISPFRFFEFVDIATGKGFETVFVCVAVVSALAALIAAYLIYTKRDVAAVV